MQSSISLGLIPVRASISFTTVDPNFAVEVSFNVPPKEPIAVLKGSQITDYISKKKSFLLLNDLKKNELLITSDTIVWFKGKAIEKPKNKQEAKEMLEELSGKKHQVFTSICISLKNQQKIVNQKTKVYFNILKKEDINYYVKKYDVRTVLEPNIYT